MSQGHAVIEREPPASGASRRAVGVMMLVVASVLWSISGVVLKTVHVPALAFAFYRSLGAGLVMIAAVPFFTGHRPPIAWMTLSVLLHAAMVALLITAMTVATAASGILLQYTAPVWCALLAWLFQRRRIDARTAIAMGIAGIGITVMIAGGKRDGGLTGPLCGVGSGICFAALILVLEKMDRTLGGKSNPAVIVLINNLGSALILLPVLVAMGQLHVRPGQFAAVAATGAVQMAAPYVLFQLALRRVHPVDASLLTLLEPVLNPVWVAMVTPERPDVGTYVGGAAILVALVLEATKKADRDTAVA